MLRKSLIASAMATALVAAGYLPAAENQTAPKPAVAAPVVTNPYLNAPPSYRSLIDQRREALERRREAYFDALLRTDPWTAAWMLQRRQEDAQYRHALRVLQRRRMDASELWRDTRILATDPWARSWRDWVRTRNYARQMALLDWEDAMTNWEYSYLPGPYAWGVPSYAPALIPAPVVPAPVVPATPAPKAEAPASQSAK